MAKMELWKNDRSIQRKCTSRRYAPNTRRTTTPLNRPREGWPDSNQTVSKKAGGFIVVDLMLPAMTQERTSGNKTTRCSRRSCRSTPCVQWSGYSLRHPKYRPSGSFQKVNFIFRDGHRDGGKGGKGGEAGGAQGDGQDTVQPTRSLRLWRERPGTLESFFSCLHRFPCTR